MERGRYLERINPELDARTGEPSISDLCLGETLVAHTDTGISYNFQVAGRCRCCGDYDTFFLKTNLTIFCIEDNNLIAYNVPTELYGSIEDRETTDTRVSPVYADEELILGKCLLIRMIEQDYSLTNPIEKTEI